MKKKIKGAFVVGYPRTSDNRVTRKKDEEDEKNENEKLKES